jgi:hypothetical protein
VLLSDDAASTPLLAAAIVQRLLGGKECAQVRLGVWLGVQASQV